MWLLSAPLDGIDRRRIAFVTLSALAAAGVAYAYAAYGSEYTIYVRRTRDPRSALRRSNAVRRRQPRHRHRAASPSSNQPSIVDGHDDDDEDDDDHDHDGHDDAHDHDHDHNGNDRDRVLGGENGDDGTAFARPHGAPAGAGGDEWPSIPTEAPTSIRTGHNIVNLLFRVSEDNARRNACVHRGCRCNSCGICPIRGLRYHCANCSDFDLCETCESQGLHIKTHVLYKIRIPNKTAGSRHMQPVWYTGDPENTRRSLPRALMPRLSRETGLERPELEAHWEQWTFMANCEWREDPDGLTLAMDRRTFERCLVSPRGQSHGGPNLIHDRIFAFYDTNRDGLITFTEYLHGISFPHRKDKLRRIFDIYDMDGDGFVSRRDFLRLFRANYVLYKDMFRDVLESMNDQRLASHETRQLVHTRQPISGHFGRDDRVPPADERPEPENKIRTSSGHFEPRAGASQIIQPDNPETISREDILMKIFTRAESPPWGPFSPEPTDVFLNGLFAPPDTVGEIPDFLVGHRPAATMGGDVAGYPDLYPDRDGEDGDEDGTGNATENRAAAVSGGALFGYEPAAGGSDQSFGHSAGSNDAARQRFMREQANMRRRATQLARRQLHDRWRRRQFFLDEEEGAGPPAGWDPEDDILPNVQVPTTTTSGGGANGGESSKSGGGGRHRAPSPRSRSSSKVRFVEDPDDFETRSNVSTSSRRSVPERWGGGLDIPVAERDAGKEILYQVTQQAYNELLDTLFKEKEDLAVRAAETKHCRDLYRTQLDAIDLNRVETEGIAGPANGDTRENGTGEEDEEAEYTSAENNDEDEDENEDEDEDEDADADDNENDNDKDSDMGQSGRLQDYDSNLEPTVRALLDRERAAPRPARTTGEGEAAAETDGAYEEEEEEEEAEEEEEEEEEEEGDEEEEGEAVVVEEAAEEAAEAAGPVALNGAHSPPRHVDPTMPQFMPCRLGEVTSRPPAPTPPPATGPEQDGTTDPPPSPRLAPAPLALNTLIEWMRIDAAEAEANARGGWGRLSFAEFEAIWHVQERRGNRLDYIGAWIEFCIL